MYKLENYPVKYIKETLPKLRDKLAKQREVTRLVRDNQDDTIMSLYAPDLIRFDYTEDLEKGDKISVTYTVTSIGEKRGGIGRKL